MALKLAKMAVIYAPSEYVTWAKLTEIYTDMNDFESVNIEFHYRLCCPSTLARCLRTASVIHRKCQRHQELIFL